MPTLTRTQTHAGNKRDTMTPKELQIEVESFTCTKHGKHVKTKIYRGIPRITWSCCSVFRKKMETHISIRSKELVIPPRSISLKKTLTDKQLEGAVDTINNLTPLVERAKEELANDYWPHVIPSSKIIRAERSYGWLVQAGYDNEVMLADLKELIDEAKCLEEKINIDLKRRYKQLEIDRAKKEEEEAKAALERRKEREEKQKAREREIKRKEAAKKRQEAKAEKERIKIIQANMPKWVKSVEAAQKFIEENDSQSYLALLSKDDLRRVVMVANALLEAMIPLRDARSEKVIGSNHADLLRAYNIAHDKLLKIIEICSGLISRKSVSNRKRTIEKQKSNKREDSSYFRKMYRLYDDRINASDKWYENESRRFNINRHEDVREYLDAYGRTIRNSLLKAEIVVEGREDVDEWGYFILGDKYLPYCLREVKVVYDNIEYHLYTFNAMTSMDDYDYDGMITDRIFYLRDRGIKTS